MILSGENVLPNSGTPALLVKTAARYTRVAIYKEEALPAPKALNISSLNILAQKSSPKLRMNHKFAAWFLKHIPAATL
jgi:hypothetical protein